MISPQIEEVDSYLQAISGMPANFPLKKADLLSISSRFLMQEEGPLTMYYAPHNEVINTAARVVIVGITPGWSQMKTALEAAKRAEIEGASTEVMLKRAKQSAGFAGSMRTHLIQMLDGIGISSLFNLSSSAELFEERTDLLHTTSIIKYPIFKNGKNYTGHAPKMDRVEMLKPYIEKVFPEELSLIEGEYLLIPLGKAVGEILGQLAEVKKIRAERCLFGFPHPSGANGHRVSQFASEQERLRSIVQAWKK
ncbi:hypothetical protein QR721_01485 [Aciduricibacillus chroicocephali]|uniref:Uracil-DNA glycosylase-like domain-containing protein n=1 Tax=Aciduricibacillus chroicocephali TaxID=3054939 RepID=A0ABY9KVW9_9BACI|nr:hypothetical protein QR721_01485 [Bacillaceae bacterium 44XB]